MNNLEKAIIYNNAVAIYSAQQKGDENCPLLDKTGKQYIFTASYRQELESLTLEMKELKVLNQVATLESFQLFQIINPKRIPLTDRDAKETAFFDSIRMAFPNRELKAGNAQEMAEMIYAFSKLELSGKSPVAAERIPLMHDVIFHWVISEASVKYLTSKRHPVSIVQALFDVIKCYKSKGKAHALKKIGGEEGVAGINSSYFAKDEQGRNVWVFKPEREESEERTGIRSGESAKREQVAYLLDDEGVFGIPETIYIDFFGEVGSMQAFSSNCKNFLQLDGKEKLARSELQGMVAFDLLFYNTDRHRANGLVQQTAEGDHVVPIDHGLILTQSDEDPMKLEYLAMEELHTAPFDPKFADLIKRKHEEHLNLLKEHGLDGNGLLWVEHAAQVLLYAMNMPGTDQENFLSPADIGLVMKEYAKVIWKKGLTEDIKELFNQVMKAKSIAREHKTSEAKRRAYIGKLKISNKSFEEKLRYNIIDLLVERLKSN